MKKLLVSAMLLMSSQLFAQETKTESRPAGSGFGAMSTIISEFNGESAVFTGTYGGWYVTKKLMIGMGGYALVSSHESTNGNEKSDDRDNIRMGYGGLVTEFTIYSYKGVHFTNTSLLAYGKVNDGYAYSASDRWEKVSDEVFVSQTSLNAEMNMTDWMRVGAGVGYRSVMGSDLADLSNKDMSGFSANLTVKFGIF